MLPPPMYLCERLRMRDGAVEQVMAEAFLRNTVGDGEKAAD